MGVYIKGMEMPKDRPQLLWVYPNGKALTVQSDVDPWKELQAVHVPLHGRLGDLDALAGQFTPDDLYYPTEEDRRDYDNHSISMRDAREVIEMAPTIIPADQI